MTFRARLARWFSYWPWSQDPQRQADDWEAQRWNQERNRRFEEAANELDAPHGSELDVGCSDDTTEPLP